ncbi:acyltransferase family protein [Mucilaginibacter angelicae]|uniref:Acyltransferase family protein n=1 Tax=Mucilaginibacter angelicae TaxID=869718 RepID=A0ABV6L507_9SPHI
MKKHNYAIDLFRFLAALMVVLFHLNQAIEPANNWYRNTVKYGWLGVPVFFVISGYCIMLSAFQAANSMDFLSRRFFRIYPPYWASLLVVLLAACVQKLYLGANAVHNLPRNAAAILANMTLATAPLTAVETSNWVYWSLTCELLFYVTVALALLAGKDKVIYSLTGTSLLAAFLPVQHEGLLFFLDQWPALGLGLSVFYFFRITDRISGFGFASLLLINLYGLLNSSVYQNDYKLVTIAATGLVLGSNYIKIPRNICSALGLYSYSVYLIHVPIGVFVLGLTESEAVKRQPVWNLIYDLSVYLVVSIIARQMYRRIEQPAIHYGRKFSQQYFRGHKGKTAI